VKLAIGFGQGVSVGGDGVGDSIGGGVGDGVGSVTITVPSEELKLLHELVTLSVT